MCVTENHRNFYREIQDTLLNCQEMIWVTLCGRWVLHVKVKVMNVISISGVALNRTAKIQQL